MQNNEKPIVLSAVLFMISVVVALLLAFTNSVTKDKIAENTLKEQNLAKQEVFSGAEDFTEVETYTDETGLVQGVFEAEDASGKVIGWCVNVSPSGYGGTLDIMVGIDSSGTVSGMKVVSHSETAGLGAKATDPGFSSQFAGKKTDAPLAVIKNGTPKENEIVAISGATITSEAVKKGVNAAIAVTKNLNGGM